MLSQRSYINSILCHYGFDDAKPVSTPMDPNICLTSKQSPKTTDEFAKMRNIPYHEAVGSLMYASLGTHPDITFAVQTVSHFSSKPGAVHEDFTLPHRFLVLPPGVHVEFLWQGAQPNFCLFPPGFHLDSRLTPWTPHGVHGVHPIPHHFTQ